MKRTSTQHDLMVRVLKAAGGQSIETLVPTGYMGSIADILFAEDLPCPKAPPQPAGQEVTYMLLVGWFG
jgi:hypothetical protein